MGRTRRGFARVDLCITIGECADSRLTMREPESSSWRDANLPRLVEEEWALLADGASPGRSLRVAPCPLPSTAQALGLHAEPEHRLGGPLSCAEDALPFEDGAWPRVVLQHVIERPGVGRSLLSESVRVLAPGGELVVFGLDPFAPGVLGRWLFDALWRREVAPVPPYRLAHVVGLMGLARVSVEGRGPRWRSSPGPGGIVRAGGWGRCLYVLRARKLEARVIPWRRAVERVEVRGAGLAPSAGRRALEVA
jgi:SAM-dependent methyltransferase